MKRVLFSFVLCLATAVCFAQPPHGGDRHHHDHHGGPDKPHHERVESVSPEQMRVVLDVLNAQSFDDKKAEIAKLCVTIGHFRVHDLAQMAATFSFDEKRLEFLKYAYSYCVDPQNYPLLRDSFSFKSNYDTLMESISHSSL